jgi:hypothetical protein
MKTKILGGFAYGAPPRDLFVAGTIQCHGVNSFGNTQAGSEIQFSDLEVGRRAKLRLVAKIATASVGFGPFNLNLGPIALPTITSLSDGFVFLDLEFVSIGYQLAGSSIVPDGIYPGIGEIHYVGKYIGGDGNSQEITGVVSANSFANLSVSLGGLTAVDQAWFVLGELSFKVEED